MAHGATERKTPPVLCQASTGPEVLDLVREPVSVASRGRAGSLIIPPCQASLEGHRPNELGLPTVPHTPRHPVQTSYMELFIVIAALGVIFRPDNVGMVLVACLSPERAQRVHEFRTRR